MCEIPKDLIDELKKRNIEICSVISVNEEKGRYVISALDKDKRDVCIKWNESYNCLGITSLRKEMSVYRWLGKTDCVPRVVCNEEILVTEYIKESITFREWILKNDDKESFSMFINEVVDKYKVFLMKLNERRRDEVETLKTDTQLEGFLSKLLYSGPYLTKIHAFERIRNSLLRKTIERKFDVDISDNNFMIHGDFHLNNILISDTKAYIIDVENVIYGNCNIELAYWYVQVWVLIYDNCEFVKILNNAVEVLLRMKFFDEKQFWNVVKLYRMAILLNSRFHKNEKKVKVMTLLSYCTE